MSILADIEDALVERLTGWELSGAPVFATVRGASGGYRAALKDAMRRELTPAAYVAFIEEPAAPETPVTRRGPRFAILVTARSLRIGDDPRHDVVDALGAFTLIAQVRAALDDFQPIDEHESKCLHQRFLDADERVAVYELLYRIQPIPEEMPEPDAPSSLEWFAQETAGEVELQWTAPADGPDAGPADFYRIYRKRAAESVFTLHDTAVREPTSKLLAGQPTGETVQFYVRAVNTGGEGPASNSISVLL